MVLIGTPYSVRRCNGIMVLRDLLFVKTPLSEADAIRSLACRALNGLSRCATVRQIISKMPLIANNELQCMFYCCCLRYTRCLTGLMREPVLADKRTEHARFCEDAQSIIWRVCGKPGTMALRNPVVRAPTALYTYRVCLNIFFQ